MDGWELLRLLALEDLGEDVPIDLVGKEDERDPLSLRFNIFTDIAQRNFCKANMIFLVDLGTFKLAIGSRDQMEAELTWMSPMM